MDKLTDVTNLTRNEVVPYYVQLIKDTYYAGIDGDDSEIIRINNLILSKWTKSGLLYIKNKAWKKLKYFFM